jgi:hypothetical protein
LIYYYRGVVSTYPVQSENFKGLISLPQREI